MMASVSGTIQGLMDQILSSDREGKTKSLLDQLHQTPGYLQYKQNLLDDMRKTMASCVVVGVYNHLISYYCIQQYTPATDHSIDRTHTFYRLLTLKMVENAIFTFLSADMEDFGMDFVSIYDAYKSHPLWSETALRDTNPRGAIAEILDEMIEATLDDEEASDEEDEKGDDL